MPAMSGRDLLESLRVEYPGIRIVYMSGYDNAEMVRRGITVTNAGFLRKPFTASELVEKINAALSGSGGANA